MVEKDNLGDWRIAAVATLAEDVPAAFPGGPSHKKGTGLYVSTFYKDENNGHLSFITPHPSALSLNLAFEYAKQSKKLQSRLAKNEVISPDGPAQAIHMANIPFLYDYFEQAMVVATFSFQAIEAFVNYELIHNAKSDIRIKRRKKWQTYSPTEAERVLSTEEKIGTVLPEVLGVPTPKGKQPWEGFLKLKDARDATIHIKNKDVHQSGDNENNLFINFLLDNPQSYPEYAFRLIEWFYKNRSRPRWLKLLTEQESFSISSQQVRYD